MRLTEKQVDILSKYLADISKILVGSIMIGYFIPVSGGLVSLPVFLSGSAMAFIFLIIGLEITR